MNVYAGRALAELRRHGAHVDSTPAGATPARIAQVRTGPRGRTPVVILPGGPGLASLVLFQGVRRRAAEHGLDVLMLDHRGVGLSRNRPDGQDLTAADVTLTAAADDVIAVLDHHGIDEAVVVGSSYGTYLAQTVAARDPRRVAALVLDSPILSVEDDLAISRAYRRALLWDGADPGLAGTAAVIRELTEAGEDPAVLSHITQVLFEFCGPEVLLRLLRARRDGRLGVLWDRLGRLGAGEIVGDGVPHVMEPRLVHGIAYRELGYGLPTDGLPLDPQALLVDGAQDTQYAGEPLDLAASLADRRCPTVVISGDRDLRTPRPVAQRIVDLAPHGVLVPLAATGHSALDTHQEALLAVIESVVAGAVDDLNGRAREISALRRRGASRLLGVGLSVVIRATTPRARTA